MVFLEKITKEMTIDLREAKTIKLRYPLQWMTKGNLDKGDVP